MDILIPDVKVLSDSGVYQSDEGYERIVIVNHWHPEKPRLMAEFNVRVDRVPGLSYALTSIWVSRRGWQQIAQRDHREFWEGMPGYLRWSNDTSEAKTATLIAKMRDDLVELITSGEVEL